MDSVVLLWTSLNLSYELTFITVISYFVDLGVFQHSANSLLKCQGLNFIKCCCSHMCMCLYISIGIYSKQNKIYLLNVMMLA